MEDKQQLKMTKTLTISEISIIEYWTSVRASHSTVLAQNFGIHAKSRSSPGSERQKKNKQKKNLKKPPETIPKQANKEATVEWGFPNQSYVPLCPVLPETYVIRRHVIKYDSNQPSPQNK